MGHGTADYRVPAAALAILVGMAATLTACMPPASNRMDLITPSFTEPIPKPTLTSRPSTKVPTRTIINCPTRSGVQVPPAPSNNDQLVQTVLAYLDSGAPPEGFEDVLVQWGVVPEIPDDFPSMITAVIDLDGDGTKEFVVGGALSILDSAPALWIFQCTGSTYSLAFQHTNEGGLLQFVIMLREEVRSPTGFPMLVFGYREWGWRNTYALVGWDGEKWRALLDEVTLVGKLAIYDRNSDSIVEVDFVEDTTGSLAGGPSRSLVTSFEWHDDEYVQLSPFLAPSNFRIHLLEDAQVALDQGLIGRAAAIYEEAAFSRNLFFSTPSDYEKSAGLEDQAEEYQTAFALFRYAILWHSVGDERTTTTALEQMDGSFPVGAPGSEFNEALSIFMEKVNAGNSNTSACLIVNSFLRSQYPHLSGTDGHIGFWGLANISYDFSDLCPF